MIGVKKYHQRIVLFCTALFALNIANAQPVLYKKSSIGSVVLYQDLKDNTLYYFAPGDLTLKTDSDGKPQFQLLQMRYTGTKLASTSGEKRFTNIAQFSVEMGKISSSTLSDVKEQLGKGITLRPLPIKNTEAHIIVPAAAVDGSNPVALNGNSSSQSDGKSGNTGKTSFWTERTFTLRLDKHSSQLLWSLLEDKKLAISVNYSFSADMIDRYNSEVLAEGDTTFTKLTEGIRKRIEEDSLIANLTSVKSGTFSIEIDAHKYPDMLKKLDINEELPPVYPTLEVKCYDFTENLTPNIMMKKVTLRATSVNGNLIELPAIKFFKKQPDLHTRQVTSEYAITLSKPLSYKVTTITEEGEKQETDWIKPEVWGEIIDVTTRAEDISTLQKSISFEYSTEDMEQAGLNTVRLQIEYTLYDELHKQKIEIYPNESNYQITNIRYDKDTKIKYRVIWKYNDDSKIVGRRKNVIDNYCYLNIPDKD